MEAKAKEIAIDSLSIKIGGREISLTIEEAKKLKTALEDLFGKDIIKIVEHQWHYNSQPLVPYYPRWGEVWCGGAGNTNPDFAQPKVYNTAIEATIDSSKVLCMSIA